MKTYVITLSQLFPVTHRRAGQPTEFKDKFLNALAGDGKERKVHTIRANYEFWRKRFDKIDRGEACLSVRQWVGKPYGKGSTQVELARLTREDGIGIQKICFPNRSVAQIYYCPTRYKLLGSYERLANCDGLSLEDWCDWFRYYDLSKPLAIIHFTKFRYR